MATVTFTGVPPLSQLHKSTPFRPELNGFDGDTKPWQMVPVGDSRFVKIDVLGTKSWTVTMEQGNFATVDQEKGTGARTGVYCITGKVDGTAAVVVNDNTGKPIDKLPLRVLRQRTFDVQFFLVSDNANHSSKTKADDIKDWVARANQKVYVPQMNLSFNLKSVTPYTVNQNLDDPVNFGNIGDMPAVPKRTPAEKRWHAITDKGDTDPKVFNVFMLWNYKANSPDTSAFVASKTPITAEEMQQKGANFNMCMMKDVPADEVSNMSWIVFAHEAGHYLEGMPFHYPDSVDGMLLMRGDGNIAERLARRDIEAMSKRW